MLIIATKKLQRVKCPVCELELDRNNEPFQKHGGRFLHQECFNVRHATTKVRNDLIDYICYLYKIKKPTGFMFRQIKEFEEAGMSPTGIQMTLQYFHEIRENSVLEGRGIGIVEYFYEEAKEYFGNLSDVINHNAEIEIDNNVRTVYISPPKKREVKLIDLEGIE